MGRSVYYCRNVRYQTIGSLLLGVIRLWSEGQQSGGKDLLAVLAEASDQQIARRIRDHYQSSFEAVIRSRGHRYYDESRPLNKVVHRAYEQGMLAKTVGVFRRQYISNAAAQFGQDE